MELFQLCGFGTSLRRVDLVVLGGVCLGCPAWFLPCLLGNVVETCKKVVGVLEAREVCESIPMRCRCVVAGRL